MVSIDDYVNNPVYCIVGVNINETNKEMEVFVSEHNIAQNSIPKVIDGYTIIILKTYA